MEEATDEVFVKSESPTIRESIWSIPQKITGLRQYSHYCLPTTR